MCFRAKRVGAAEGSEVTSSKPLKMASKLLKVTPAALTKAITFRSIEVSGKKTLIPLNPSEALDACDALAKAVYGKLFDWLVKRVNAATDEKAHGHGATAGGATRPRFIGKRNCRPALKRTGPIY